MQFVQLVAIVNIYAHFRTNDGERGRVTSSLRDNQVATENSEVAPHLIWCREEPLAAAVPSPTLSPDHSRVSVRILNCDIC